tara:strand:+ start:803 stop:1294 length:492 start_codon:yes stop_codon:yes gene_type:complete
MTLDVKRSIGLAMLFCYVAMMFCTALAFMYSMPRSVDGVLTTAIALHVIAALLATFCPVLWDAACGLRERSIQIYAVNGYICFPIVATFFTVMQMRWMDVYMSWAVSAAAMGGLLTLATKAAEECFEECEAKGWSFPWRYWWPIAAMVPVINGVLLLMAFHLS